MRKKFYLMGGPLAVCALALVLPCALAEDLPRGPVEAPPPVLEIPLPTPAPREPEPPLRREERPLNHLGVNIRPPIAYDHEERRIEAVVQMPENLYARDQALILDRLPAGHPPGYHPPGARRSWAASVFAWDAPALSHRPLYFEEPNLERHGYHFGLVQPLVSGAYFFGRLPALPYLKTVDPPHVAQYTLGQARPGSPVPYRHELVPLRADAALVQAVTVMVWAFAL